MDALASRARAEKLDAAAGDPRKMRCAVFGEFTRERSAGVDAVVEGHGDVGDDPAEERGGGHGGRE